MDSIIEGRIPRLLRTAYRQSGITLVSDLLCLFESTRLESVQSYLSVLENLKISEFRKISKLLRKGITQDITTLVGVLLSRLALEEAYSPKERATLQVLLSQYLKGPFRLFLIEVLRLLEGVAPRVGPVPKGYRTGVLDTRPEVLSRTEMEVLDRIIRFGRGPLSLYKES